MSNLSELAEVNDVSVEDYLKSVDYRDDPNYVPSEFALKFVTFIKLVHGGDPENKTPVIHYKMLDNFNCVEDTINACHRGVAKTSLMEYLIFYIAVFKGIPVLPDIPYALYVSDSMDNGVRKMRKSLELTWDNSDFLQHYLPETRFIDDTWEFTRQDGTMLIVTGHGAATGVRGPLALDCIVYTDKGTKTIAEIKEGDKVFTPEGTETEVIGKSEVFNDPMYKLTFDDGRTLKCDGSHLHPLYIRKVSRVDGKQSTRYEKKLFTTNDLVNGKPLINGTYRRYFTKAVKPVRYSEKEFIVEPYVLGLLLGDGNMPKGKTVRLAGLLEDVDEYIERIHNIDLTEVPFKERSGIEMKRISFLGLHSAIAELGLAGKVDKEKSIPVEYQRGSIKQRRELLAGLLDTDGTCGKEGQVSYSTISHQLANDITELARSLGYLVRVASIDRENKQVLHRVYIRGDINPFVLKRKRELFRVPAKRSDRVALISIEAIADEPSQCIRVEDNVHEFITDNYLATHNTRENNSRPVLALLDDLLKDSDATSPAIIEKVEATIYKAIDYALHPQKRKIIWNGTFFNQRDPLYKAIASGAWRTNVFPICEVFPCEREDFRGSWEDRFSYDYVLAQYTKAIKSGKLDTFNQELMLRVMSEEDRLISDQEIRWYSREPLIQNIGRYNIYITTDFATGEKASNDFSVISVWAYANNGFIFWIDGICVKQLMDKNIDDLFRLCQKYNPIGVGVEVSGQQSGFIPWIKNEMIRRNIFFNLSSENNEGKEGIRPLTDKLKRFMVALPWFKSGMIYFPQEFKTSAPMREMVDELSMVSRKGFKSRHDDFCFSGDTSIKVKTRSGKIAPIKFRQLCNGDVVEGYNEATGTFEWVQVENFIMTGVKQTFTVIDSVDSEIHLTDNHPVMTQRGWVEVKYLTTQDLLLCRSKATVISGLKRKVGIISLQLISLMERGIGYIKKFI